MSNLPLNMLKIESEKPESEQDDEEIEEAKEVKETIFDQLKAGVKGLNERYFMHH